MGYLVVQLKCSSCVAMHSVVRALWLAGDVMPNVFYCADPSPRPAVKRRLTPLLRCLSGGGRMLCLSCRSLTLAYLATAVWVSLSAWAVYRVLAASPEAPLATVSLDVVAVISAAAVRLLLVLCRPSNSLPVAGRLARRRRHLGARADGDGDGVAFPLPPRFVRRRLGIGLLPGEPPAQRAVAAPALAVDAAAVAPPSPYVRGEAGCAAECAVCLGEVEEGQPVRRLPACAHAFHRRCIDRWLRGHSTCPVCRRDVLTPSPAARSIVRV
ncbi:hypothetical protein ACP4OV_009198 [Aristida adscensionis]